MRLASGCGTGDMSLACRQLCLVHASCYAAFGTRHQCLGLVSVESDPQAPCR